MFTLRRGGERLPPNRHTVGPRVRRVPRGGVASGKTPRAPFGVGHSDEAAAGGVAVGVGRLALGGVAAPRPRARDLVEGPGVGEHDELGFFCPVDDGAIIAVAVVPVEDAEDLLLAEGAVVEAEPERDEGRQDREGELEEVRVSLRFLVVEAACVESQPIQDTFNLSVPNDFVGNSLSVRRELGE